MNKYRIKRPTTGQDLGALDKPKGSIRAILTIMAVSAVILMALLSGVLPGMREPFKDLMVLAMYLVGTYKKK